MIIRNRRTCLHLLPVLGLSLGLGGCFSEGPADPVGGDPAVTVEMNSQLRFEPQHVTVSVGEAIRWRNTSSFPHTVTADPQLAANPAVSVRLPTGASTFHSGSIQANADYQLTFTVPGEYTYFCLPHEGSGMIGTITVTP